MNIKHKIVEELVLLLLPLLKKAHKARTCWYHRPFRWFMNVRFLKKYKKGWTEAQKNLKKNINAS